MNNVHWEEGPRGDKKDSKSKNEKSFNKNFKKVVASDEIYSNEIQTALSALNPVPAAETKPRTDERKLRINLFKGELYKFICDYLKEAKQFTMSQNKVPQLMEKISAKEIQNHEASKKSWSGFVFTAHQKANISTYLQKKFPKLNNDWESR